MDTPHTAVTEELKGGNRVRAEVAGLPLAPYLDPSMSPLSTLSSADTGNEPPGKQGSAQSEREYLRTVGDGEAASHGRGPDGRPQRTPGQERQASK